MSEPASYDVIIAGGGPVGLLIACEVATTGCSVLVLEKEVESAENDAWRNGVLGLRGLNNPSAELLYRRGFLDKIRNNGGGGGPPAPGSFDLKDMKFAGHFAGIHINAEKVDFSRWKHILPGPSVFGGGVRQGKVMALFQERALELGVEILRGREVTSIAEEESHVKVGTPQGSFTARYLVGADGGRSNVRHLGGFEFEGSEATWTGYAVHADLRNPDLLGPGFVRTKNGMYVHPPPKMWGGTGYYLMHFDLSFDRNKPVTTEHLQKVFKDITAKDIIVDKIHLAGTFTDRTKQVTEYRRGRIFLAGDAAHIHAPLGGQGLNLGLGDGMNLGWKLGAVVKGHADESLLATYHEERHPYGEKILEHTRAQTAAIRPGLHGEAVCNLVKELSETRDGATHLAGKFSWYDRRMDFGEDNEKHELVGRSAPDFDFEDGTRLGPRFEKGKWVVVDFGKSERVKELTGKMEALAEYVNLPAKESFGLKTAVARPDGVIVWATEEEFEMREMKAAWRKWLKHAELEGES